jgi:hypothetical protein
MKRERKKLVCFLEWEEIIKKAEKVRQEAARKGISHLIEHRRLLIESKILPVRLLAQHRFYLLSRYKFL